MIGVLANHQEKEIVSEFFELFKTPWEFYDEKKTYDVIITTTDDCVFSSAKLVIIYASSEKPYDKKLQNKIDTLEQDILLNLHDSVLPIYGNASAITGNGQPCLKISKHAGYAGLKQEITGQQIIRVGYNLFQEVGFLLTEGQPSRNALISALDLHITVFRSLILGVGIPVVEIPPVPAGYNFIVCLTHDIDFIRMRDHIFDHTMWGFLYRATIGSLLDVIKGKRSLQELYQNWKAALMLPLVFLGLYRDFWFMFDRYMELEESVGARSTFFFIPYKNKMGDKVPGKGASMRAAKYDVTDIQDTLQKLVQKGFEVGVHGIDSWHSTASAYAEKARISEISGKPEVGVRMHWLCFDKDSHRILEDAGFTFDSTFGYNDAVGYRAGTSQAFRPINTSSIFELPLHIQDTALFNPRHMSLNKTEAWNRCEELIKNTSCSGGILTILWHDRSLAPERLYEDFYIKLLIALKNKEVWFATGTEACKWFNNRRAAKFENIIFDGNIVHIKMHNHTHDDQPSMRLRIYYPANNQNQQSPYYHDTQWQGESELSISVVNSQNIKTV